MMEKIESSVKKNDGNSKYNIKNIISDFGTGCTGGAAVGCTAGLVIGCVTGDLANTAIGVWQAHEAFLKLMILLKKK
eukprot:jgi/Orpsp1_1/1179227/evm.model.c7180000068495.1